MTGLPLQRILVPGAWCLLLAGKLLLAAHIELYADEAFYFQCSLRPAIAYADLPPLTAMVVGAGTWLWGTHPFGVRFFFVVAGMVTPLLVYLLARRFGSHLHALYAATAACLIPGFGFLGLFAIPDVLLALFSLLFLLLFDSACQRSRLVLWIGLGITAGLGLLTHYRFSLVIVAVWLFLFFTKQGRSLLKAPGIWISGIVAVPGILPGLVYNLNHGIAPLKYFLGTRHQRHFHLEKLGAFLAEQLAVITPLMWILLMVVLFHLLKAAKSKDTQAMWFALFTLVPLIVYALASPLHATGAQSFHWPLAAYFPLLAWLPRVITSLQTPSAQWRKWRYFLIAAPILAGFISGVLFVDLASGRVGIPGFREPFSGWAQLAEKVEDQLESLKAQNIQVAAVVADNYKLGAQLELYLDPLQEVYILDHSKNYEHGRQRQFGIWQRGEEALRNKSGKVVLVAVLWSELATARDVWERHIQWHFQPLQELETLVLEDASGAKYSKVMTLYLGVVIPKR